MSAAVSRLLSLLHGGPQVIRNGLGFSLTVIAKKNCLWALFVEFLWFLWLPLPSLHCFHGWGCSHCLGGRVVIGAAATYSRRNGPGGRTLTCTVYLDIVSIFAQVHKVIGPFKAELQFRLKGRSDRTWDCWCNRMFGASLLWRFCLAVKIYSTTVV